MKLTDKGYEFPRDKDGELTRIFQDAGYGIRVVDGCSQFYVSIKGEDVAVIHMHLDSFVEVLHTNHEGNINKLLSECELGST